MKDYIAAEKAPYISAGMVALAMQTSQNTRDIAEIATDVRTLSNKVERNESFLQKVMSNFIDPSTFKHFLILNGQWLEADVAYTQIYGMAKSVSVKIFSEQHGRTRLTESMLLDFGTDSEKLFHCGASSKDAGDGLELSRQHEFFLRWEFRVD
jgi:hypothetical protein